MTTAEPGDGTWDFDDSWRAFAGLEGGLVLGAVAETARRVTAAHARPGAVVAVRSVQVHFLHQVATGEAFTVAAHPWRQGGTTSLALQVQQGGTTRAVGQVLLSTLTTTAATGAEDPGDPASVDTPSDGEPLELPVGFVPVSQHVEIRAVGPGRPLTGGPDPRLAAWVRLRDPDALPEPLLALGLITDVLPPSRYATTTSPVVMPTVELTVHLHRPPPGAGSWVRVEQWTDHQDAYGCIDDAVLHDEDGTVLARSRQTRRVPRADPRQ